MHVTMSNYQMIYQCFTVFLDLEETPVICNDFNLTLELVCYNC
jgi:hypothetical protein